ncbi:MAG TPA: CocE/NonD family hydrolase [Ktedonobacteraceae bacterium]|nr:CocE/NonD family hydrolase [Ktedonobacteraceae bacterium]
MITPNLEKVRIDFHQRVPMRDGVLLSADVYRPVEAAGEEKTYPVVLMRTPYMKANQRILEYATYLVEHGYVFVAQDVRGRGDSDGEFVPYFNEGRDGYDAIEWCAAQSWSNNNVGTVGSSYPGRIQWLAALEQPPHLRTMIVRVAPSDPFVETPTGLPSPMHLCWLHLVSGHTNQLMEAVDWPRVYEHLPLLTMDEQTGHHNPFWRADLEHPQLDAYWEPLRYQSKFEQIALPVLHISGWYDDEQIGTPLNYTGMSTCAATAEARANQRLLMGPWGHAVNTESKLGEVDFGPQSLIDLRGEELRWFDRWLKGSTRPTGAPVRIFIMGTNRWRDEQEWPLARTQWTPYYLHSAGRANSRFGDGALSTTPPVTQEPPDNYRYDPARPVPFITEPTSSQIGGPDDYSAIERRDDVLVYVTAPLNQEIEVTGPIRVELYASSSVPDTDFTAKLVDIWPTGFAQRLCDGMVRARFRKGMAHPTLIEPNKIYHYTIDCWNTAQVFKPSHRIGLEISSSAFPKYDRNLNTGAPLGLTTEMAVAEQKIYHDEEHPSALVLPIIAGE